jgi:Mechanosensitive ion channel, conserved TM helix
MGIRETFASALGRVILFVPHLLSALLILAAGLLVAWILAWVTRKLLHAVGLDRFLARHDVAPGGGGGRASTLVGRVVYWVIALVTFVAAADALQLPWVTTGLARVVGYLPNVFAAALIVLVGYIAGNACYRAIARRRPATNALMWARLGRAAIFVLAGFMAIQELQVAVGIVTTLFALTFGAMAVAVAIAFGLGNRELAGRVTRDWWERNHPPRMEDTEATRFPMERPFGSPTDEREPRH